MKLMNYIYIQLYTYVYIYTNCHFTFPLTRQPLVYIYCHEVYIPSVIFGEKLFSGVDLNSLSDFAVGSAELGVSAHDHMSTLERRKHNHPHLPSLPSLSYYIHDKCYAWIMDGQESNKPYGSPKPVYNLYLE